MSTLLDIMQSVVVGSIIFIMILNFNFKMQTVLDDVVSNKIVQSDAVDVVNILEYDLLKIGLNVTKSEKIIDAQSEKIQFRSDYNNDGIVDSITYFITDSLGVNNPGDRNLLRKINERKEQIVGRINQFNIEYYDSLGKRINIGSLTNTAKRTKISAIGINLKVESNYLIDKRYSSSTWNKKIKIKNK